MDTKVHLLMLKALRSQVSQSKKRVFVKINKVLRTYVIYKQKSHPETRLRYKTILTYLIEDLNDRFSYHINNYLEPTMQFDLTKSLISARTIR